MLRSKFVVDLLRLQNCEDLTAPRILEVSTHDIPLIVLVTRGRFEEKRLPAPTALKRIGTSNFEAIVGVGDVRQ